MKNTEKLEYAKKTYSFADKIKRLGFYNCSEDTTIKKSNDTSNNVPHIYGTYDDVYLGQNKIYCGKNDIWATIQKQGLDLRRTKIWIGDDPELYKQVQEELFELGVNWTVGDEKSICHSKNMESLFVNENLRMAKMNIGNREYYDSHRYKELSIVDLGITKKGIVLKELPQRWCVAVKNGYEHNPEIYKWRNSTWGSQGYIDENKYHSPDIGNRTLITSEQFMKWVYNPTFQEKLNENGKPLKNFTVGSWWTNVSNKEDGKGFVRVASAEVKKVHNYYYTNLQFDRFRSNDGKIEKDISWGIANSQMEQQMIPMQEENFTGRWLKCLKENIWSYTLARPKIGEYVQITSHTPGNRPMVRNAVGEIESMSFGRFTDRKEYELMPLGFTPTTSKEDLVEKAKKLYKDGDIITRVGFAENDDQAVIRGISYDPFHFVSNRGIFAGNKMVYCDKTKLWATVIGNESTQVETTLVEVENSMIGKKVLFENKQTTIIGLDRDGDAVLLMPDNKGWRITDNLADRYKISYIYIGEYAFIVPTCNLEFIDNNTNTESKIIVKSRGNVLLPTQEVKKRRIL